MTANKALGISPASSRTKRAEKNGHRHPVPAAPPKSVRRRDGGGHLNPSYRAELLKLSSRPPPADLAAPFIGGSRTSDELAEQFGEQAIVAATTGESNAPDALDCDAPEDLVSPFWENGLEDEAEEEEEED